MVYTDEFSLWKPNKYLQDTFQRVVTMCKYFGLNVNSSGSMTVNMQPFLRTLTSSM